MKPEALFLFAHPDDEFGIFHRLKYEADLGRRIRCAYLTDGGAGTASPQQRLAESTAILRRFGVAAEDVLFPGFDLAIPDSGLPARLDVVQAWLEEQITQRGKPAAVYLPAWEGGHHDHDGLHAAALMVCARHDGMLDRMHQFSLYQASGCKPPWFKVMTPLSANGVVETTRIAWTERLQYVRHCLGYPSQWRSWAGLFPFVAWHYLIRGEQHLQPVSMPRLLARPHQGTLYYEQRNFHTWEQMRKEITRRLAAPDA